MTIPNDFQFSQQHLQDYLDCPRRFELKYIQKLAWPAIQNEPVLEIERHLLMGSQFHNMIHQYVLGLPPETIASQLYDLDLIRWWNNYLSHDPLSNLPHQRYSELTLSTPFLGYRIVGKFDLIAIKPEQEIVIVDWKTNRKRLPHKYLSVRLQTILYPFLLVSAGIHLNDGLRINPDQVRMVYWFTDFPADPLIFPYNQEEFNHAQEYLCTMINRIIEKESGGYPLTQDEKTCQICKYRSFCDRGSIAGHNADFSEIIEEQLSGFLIDYEQIGEIAF